MKLSNNPLWIENRMTRVVFDALNQLAQVWYFFLHPSIIFKYKDENLWRQSDICLNDGTYNLLVLMLVVVLVVVLVMVVVVSLASQAPNFPRFRCLSRWSSAEASIPNPTWLKSQIGFVAMDGSQNNEKGSSNQANILTKKGRREKSLDHWPCSGWLLITHSLFLSHFFRSVQSQKCSITSPFLQVIGYYWKCLICSYPQDVSSCIQIGIAVFGRGSSRPCPRWVFSCIFGNIDKGVEGGWGAEGMWGGREVPRGVLAWKQLHWPHTSFRRMEIIISMNKSCLE